MATAPLAPQTGYQRILPDYLPARMVNEFVYCPRLFFYEWVEGVFVENADTLEGAAQHQRVDREGPGLPAPAELAPEQTLKTRSVTLSSERLRVIATLDLAELAGGCVTPVDYKHGRPREGNAQLEAWPPDRIQLALQGLILREHGYRCEEGIIFYHATRQRVPFTAELFAEAEHAVAGAWSLAAHGPLPEPLIDSPKCAGCSLAPVCLPDEVSALRSGLEASSEAFSQLPLFSPQEPPRKPPARELRRLLAPRQDLRPVYLNTPGLRVGKSGAVLEVKDKDSVVQQVRIPEICQLNLMGNVQISTQAVHALCEAGVPVCYFSMGGWFYGITTGLCTKNVFVRQTQYGLANQEWFCLKLARELVAAKVRNQRTLLLRNHIEPDANALAGLKQMAERAAAARSLPELLGIEGHASRLYFGQFQGMIKLEPETRPDQLPKLFRFDFAGRNRRPPRDAVNALLSLGYALLTKDLTIAGYAAGFDPMMGFYHQPRFGRPALALDLMEPFRPLIVDSAVLTAINTGMVTPADFLAVGDSVALKPQGRKAFFRAYELRMDTLVTHPLFGYRVSYRRLLELQVRLLAKVMEGELEKYPAFVTR
jgi:CRISPR-associated protein Cas1